PRSQRFYRRRRMDRLLPEALDRQAGPAGAALLGEEKATMRKPELKTTELTLTRLIPATPGEVFDVWLDAKSPGSPWFGVTRAIVQPIVDGLFYHLVQFENHDWAHYGRFIALDRPSRIEHTWVSEATRGPESRVALTFETEDD